MHEILPQNVIIHPNNWLVMVHLQLNDAWSVKWEPLTQCIYASWTCFRVILSGNSVIMNGRRGGRYMQATHSIYITTPLQFSVRRAVQVYLRVSVFPFEELPEAVSLIKILMVMSIEGVCLWLHTDYGYQCSALDLTSFTGKYALVIRTANPLPLHPLLPLNLPTVGWNMDGLDRRVNCHEVLQMVLLKKVYELFTLSTLVLSFGTCLQVVLIVNVATYWGYTHQYTDMNVLQESFTNFEVLAFPCNQFGKVSAWFGTHNETYTWVMMGRVFIGAVWRNL